MALSLFNLLGELAGYTRHPSRCPHTKHDSHIGVSKCVTKPCLRL
jgi:hypothetical protein